MFKTRKSLYISVIVFTIFALRNPLIIQAQNYGNYVNQFSFPHYSINANASAMSFTNYTNMTPQRFTMPAFSPEYPADTAHYGENYFLNSTINNGLAYNNAGNSSYGSFIGIEPSQQFQMSGNQSFFTVPSYNTSYSMGSNNPGTNLYQSTTNASSYNTVQTLSWQPVQATSTSLFTPVQAFNNGYSINNSGFNAIDIQGFNVTVQHDEPDGSQIVMPAVQNSTDTMDDLDFGIKELNTMHYTDEDTGSRHSH